MDVLGRHNVRVSGRPEGRAMVFAHGFGCDQQMWRFVAPAFERDFRVIMFDHAGCGAAGGAAYHVERHASLQGYAEDVVAICRELEVDGGVFVGHSVSAMIGVLADRAAPELFDQLVLIGPSPRYIDEEGYLGGFSEDDIGELLDALDSNYLGWSSAMAPAIMGNADRPELAAELTASFCRTAPDLARRFAEVTFRSDNRADLRLVRTPTLVLQCRHDAIAAVSVGQYVAEHIPDCALVILETNGHCPHLSAPEQTIAAIAPFVRGTAAIGP